MTELNPESPNQPEDEQAAAWRRGLMATAAAGAAVHEAVVETMAGAAAGYEDWAADDESPLAEVLKVGRRPATLWQLYERHERLDTVPDEEIQRMWSGPIRGPGGPIEPHQIDEVLAAAILCGGRIPNIVALSTRDYGIITGALAVMGFPVRAARRGSSPEQRERAGLTGPDTINMRDQKVWLPSEDAVSRHLQERTTVAGLIVAAAIFEHRRSRGPKDFITKVQVGTDSTEQEKPRNKDEAELLRFVNESIIFDAYGTNDKGESQMRNVPGSVAPLLLARGVEMLGRRSTPFPVLAASLLRLYAYVWEDNPLHIASYPDELKRLASDIIYVDKGMIHTADFMTKQQTPGIGRLSNRDREALVYANREDYYAYHEIEHLSELAQAYGQNRAASLEERIEEIRLKRQAKTEAAKVAAERAVQASFASVKYNLELVRGDRYTLWTDGIRALDHGDVAVTLRNIMVLHELQMVPGYESAQGDYEQLWDAAQAELADYLYTKRRAVIASGHFSPDEAKCISLLHYGGSQSKQDLQTWHLKTALRRGMFSTKTIMSPITDTTTGEKVRIAPVKADYPSMYSDRVRDIKIVIATVHAMEDGLNIWLQTRNAQGLPVSSRKFISRLSITRRNWGIEQVALIQRDPKYGAKDISGLKAELLEVEGWKRWVRQIGGR